MSDPWVGEMPEDTRTGGKWAGSQARRERKAGKVWGKPFVEGGHVVRPKVWCYLHDEAHEWGEECELAATEARLELEATA